MTGVLCWPNMSLTQNAQPERDFLCQT